MNKYYVKVIAEGGEECAFFDIVKQIGVHENIHIDVEDSNGYGGIPDAVLFSLREDIYDCVVCVYDVDNRVEDEKSPYNITRKQLISIFEDERVVDAISFCTNPNILQYFLLAADSLNNVSLSFTSKTTNSKLVHKYWPQIASGKRDNAGRTIKSSYDASSWQLDLIKYSIINNDYKYDDLLENAKMLPTDYKNNLPGGNLLPLLIALKEGDTGFFKTIAKLTDSI